MLAAKSVRPLFSRKVSNGRGWAQEVHGHCSRRGKCTPGCTAHTRRAAAKQWDSLRRSEGVDRIVRGANGFSERGRDGSTWSRAKEKEETRVPEYQTRRWWARDVHKYFLWPFAHPNDNDNDDDHDDDSKRHVVAGSEAAFRPALILTSGGQTTTTPRNAPTVYHYTNTKNCQSLAKSLLWVANQRLRPNERKPANRSVRYRKRSVKAKKSKKKTTKHKS